MKTILESILLISFQLYLQNALYLQHTFHSSTTTTNRTTLRLDFSHETKTMTHLACESSRKQRDNTKRHSCTKSRQQETNRKTNICHEQTSDTGQQTLAPSDQMDDF